MVDILIIKTVPETASCEKGLEKVTVYELLSYTAEQSVAT